MSCFSNPSSTGSQCRVTGISDSSTIVGTPARRTLKVAIITMWMSSAGAPQRQLRLEAPPEPPVELLVDREGLVGHVLDHRLEAVARRHDLLDLADQQHQVLRLAGCGDGVLPLRQAPRVDRVALARPRTAPARRAGRAARRRARSCARPPAAGALRTVAQVRLPAKPGMPARQLGLVPQVVQQAAQRELGAVAGDAVTVAARWRHRAMRPGILVSGKSSFSVVSPVAGSSVIALPSTCPRPENSAGGS